MVVVGHELLGERSIRRYLRLRRRRQQRRRQGGDGNVDLKMGWWQTVFKETGDGDTNICQRDMI